MTDNTKKTDDFFNTLEKDKATVDPFAATEIAFRDADGNLKVLKEGQVLDFSDEASSESSAPTSVESIVAPAVNQTSLEIETSINDVVKGTGIKFNDKLIERRFANIVGSIFKGARNRVQAREAFTKPMEEGGMGFDDKVADNVLKVIKEKKHAHEDQFRDKMDSSFGNNLQHEMDQLLKSSARQESRNQSLVFEQDFIPKDMPAKEENDDVDFLSGTTDEPSSERNTAKSVVKTPAVQPKKPLVAQDPIMMPKPVTGPDPDKPTVQDVKFEPRLTGPIEEIKSMSLNDFRKLSANPVEAVHKILDKINLLEEESFTLKVQGVKAWKDSIINRMYIELGDVSMESKKTIDEVIAQRQEAGEDVLTAQEVEAIIELNKLLRY